MISNALLWHHRLVPGLLTRYAVPVIGSAVVLRFANINSLAESTAGRYVVGHMPPEMMALRLTGDTLIAIGAWSRHPKWIALGVLTVGLGWSHGVIGCLKPTRG